MYNQGSMHTPNMRHSCKFLTIDHLCISYSTTIGCRFPGVGQVKLFPAHVKTMSYLYQCINCHSHLRVLADNTKKKVSQKYIGHNFSKITTADVINTNKILRCFLLSFNSWNTSLFPCRILEQKTMIDG